MGVSSPMENEEVEGRPGVLKGGEDFGGIRREKGTPVMESQTCCGLRYVAGVRVSSMASVRVLEAGSKARPMRWTVLPGTW